MNPRISIITVCFNSAATIERTIESVLKQTYQNYEYIIVDGKSTDNTLDIVRKYEPYFNGKMKVVSEPDKGIYDAMNKGIRLATGELIGIINSDDYYELDALESILGSFFDDKYVVLYGLQRTLRNGREINVVLYHHSNIDNQMITHPTCFISKQVYEDYGLYSIKYKSSADYEFMLRLIHDTDVVFRPVYKIITNFELGGMSSSETGYRETLALLKRYGSISNKQYYVKLLKSYLHDLLQ